MFTILLQIQNPASRPGTGDFATHSLEIFAICLIMFALGWSIYHLMFGNKYKTTIRDLEGNLNSARTRISDLEGDLEGCNSAIVNIKGENAALSTKLAKLDTGNKQGEKQIKVSENSGQELSSTLEETLVSGLASDIAGSGNTGYDAKGANAVFGKMLLEDDLKIVEGIGPKTAQLLNVNSIHTWKQLGSTSVPQLQNLLSRSGGRFQFLNPSTWPKQARMASEGEWVKLREYQDYLIGGVEPVDKDPPMRSEAATSNYLFGRKIEQDDLTLIDGVGKKINALLQENGVTTWAELADTSIKRLQEILDSAGDKFRMHNPTNWPKQAAMAADEKWDELREYQEFLQGGKMDETAIE